MRFVVLHHTGYGPEHFDVMFEIAGVSGAGCLLTFRAPRWPIAAGDELERLPDHRMAYLDYEGPVSGGRGMVRRVIRGTYVASVTPDSGSGSDCNLDLELEWESERCSLHLRQQAGPNWTVVPGVEGVQQR